MNTRIFITLIVLLAAVLLMTACHDVASISVRIPPEIKAGLDRETLARIDEVNDTLAEGFGLDPETRALIEEFNKTLASVAENGVGLDEATLQRVDRLLADIEAGVEIGLDYETRQTVEKLIATLGTAPQAWGQTLNEIIRTLEASSARIADKMADEVRDLLDQAALDVKEIGASTGEQFFCTYKVLSTDLKNNVNTYIAMSLADRLKVILFGAEMPPVTMAPEVCQIIPSQVDLEKRGNTLLPKNNAVIITGYGFAEINRPRVYLLAAENGTQLAEIVPLVNTSYRMTLNLQAVDSFDKVQKGAQVVFEWPGGIKYGMAVFLPEEEAVATLTIKNDSVDVPIRKCPSSFCFEKRRTRAGVVHEVKGGYDGWWLINYETDTNSGVFDVGWIPADVAVRNEVPAPVITAPLPPPGADIRCDVPSTYVPVDVVCTANQTEGQSALVEWEWQCDDRSGTQSNNPITCQYTTAGTYQVTLKITNDMGWGVAVPVSVTVNDKPPGPKAAFSAWPQAGEAPLTVTFTNLTEGSLPNWTWEFDDNTSSFSNNDPVLSPEQKRTFSHTFDNPGTYDVTLSVSDHLGQSDKVTLTIVVSPQSNIYQGAMFIMRYVGVFSSFDGTAQKVHFAPGYKNQDFQCGIIGMRAQGGMVDPSCEGGGGGCISAISQFTEVYMEPDATGEWWINASITTFPGYGVMEPSRWDIDMLCVHHNVLARDGARYITYSTVSNGPGVRSDLLRDSNTNEYRADTGVSASDFTCGLVGYAFQEGWYGPNPAYDFKARVEAIDGRWMVRTLFRDITTGPAVWTRANVLCLSKEAPDIVYLSTDLPNPNTGQYARRLDLPAGSYNCGVVGVDVSGGRMNTSTGYQELLLAQARQLPDGGWEVRAGMPRVAEQGETWKVDLICLASRYVLLDLTTAP